MVSVFTFTSRHGRKSRGGDSFPRIWSGNANTNCPQIFCHKLHIIHLIISVRIHQNTPIQVKKIFFLKRGLGMSQTLVATPPPVKSLESVLSSPRISGRFTRTAVLGIVSFIASSFSFTSRYCWNTAGWMSVVE